MPKKENPKSDSKPKDQKGNQTGITKGKQPSPDNKQKPKDNKSTAKDNKATATAKDSKATSKGKKNPKERSQSPKDKGTAERSKSPKEKEEPQTNTKPQLPLQPIPPKEKKKKDFVVVEKSKWIGRPPHIILKPMFSLKYNYRRENFTLTKINPNALLEDIRIQISKQIEAPKNELVILFNEKEITNPNEKVFDLIKNESLKYVEVKRKIKVDETTSLPNLSSTNYIFKVYVDNPPSGIDLFSQVDNFFKQLLLDKNVIVEPTKFNQYVVSFPTLDLAFDFKRFMIILQKENPLYSKIKIKMTTPEPEIKASSGRTNTMPFLTEDSKKSNPISIHRKKEHISIYLNHGAYSTYDELRKKEEQKSKKKWITKRGFLTMLKPEEEE